MQIGWAACQRTNLLQQQQNLSGNICDYVKNVVSVKSIAEASALRASASNKLSCQTFEFLQTVF